MGKSLSTRSGAWATSSGNRPEEERAMRPTAIVYTSATGFTARYAALLSRQTGLPAYGLREP